MWYVAGCGGQVVLAEIFQEFVRVIESQAFSGSLAPIQLRVAIQGELGSNSHMAALEVLGPDIDVVPCRVSADVFERLSTGMADKAVLPIENSLHGSVTEHYDLLREGVWIAGESMLRIVHNVIAAPGVTLEQVRRVSSHPVALSQCRRWLRDHPEIEVVTSTDTAGSVKELMASGARDTAGIAPALAAKEYGAEVLVAGVEDHAENWTRFYVLERPGAHSEAAGANKISLAFALEHRPGTLVEALRVFQEAGVNLTKIESRPVMGEPWEYSFFVDMTFEDRQKMEQAVEALRGLCREVRVLGVYRAAAAG